MATMEAGPHIARNHVHDRQVQKDDPNGLPLLLTVDDTAGLLRTSRRAIYAMIARRQLPGVVRIRRRVLIRTADLLDWVVQNRAPLPKE